MNKTLASLLPRLKHNEEVGAIENGNRNGFIGTLASVYEKARNALEYRASNLVRRAAIERILKRRFLLNKDPESISKNLVMELKWARYLPAEGIGKEKEIKLNEIVKKYIAFIDGPVPMEWVIKIASSEIEEFFNPNTDYRQFSLFAFHEFKKRIDIENPNMELLIYYAVDKVYAASDDEQIAYHILQLSDNPANKKNFAETWKLFNLAKNYKNMSRIYKFIRKQMPPLVLIRDMYFYSPKDFHAAVQSKIVFKKMASEVLDYELDQLSGRIKTAGVRSIVYVFLTKMILAFGMEVPLEILFYKEIGFVPLAINLAFPPLLMWFATMQIKTPDKQEKEGLINESWEITGRNDTKDMGTQNVEYEIEKRSKNPIYWIFSVFYGIFFIGVFAVIFLGLEKIGFTLFSKVVFIFFLCVIAFFAYRIVQIAQVYSWKKDNYEETGVLDILALPILAIGSRLSKGLSKLNFLAFAFDFILEAPFKIILSFIEAWLRFLSIKKDEEIVE